jgi:hypothetical protein
MLDSILVIAVAGALLTPTQKNICKLNVSKVSG